MSLPHIHRHPDDGTYMLTEGCPLSAVLVTALSIVLIILL